MLSLATGTSTAFGEILQHAHIALNFIANSSDGTERLQRRQRRIHLRSACADKQCQLALRHTQPNPRRIAMLTHR